MTKLSPLAQKVRHFLEERDSWNSIKSPDFPDELAVVILKKSAVHLGISTNQIAEIVQEILISKFNYTPHDIETIWRRNEFMGEDTIQNIFSEYISDKLDDILEY